MWDKKRVKSVKTLYEKEVLEVPAIFKTRDDYILFLMAQAWQESGWDEKALSKTGCKGWAQFELSTWRFVWKSILKAKDIPSIWDVRAQMIAQHTYMKYLIRALLNKEPMLPRKELLASSLMAYNGGLEVISWCLEYHGAVSVIALRDYKATKKSNYPNENKIFEILNYPISIFHIWNELKEVMV